MKNAVCQIVLMVIALLASATPASADVAVLMQITDESVTVRRVERSESAESIEQDRSDAIIKRRASSLDEPIKGGSDNNLVIEWFDASGALVHRETRPDPRFVHAPGGEDAVLPEAMILMRAPASAVEMRVRPRGYVNFTHFNV